MDCFHCSAQIDQTWEYCALCGARAGRTFFENLEFSGPGPFPLTFRTEGKPVRYEVHDHQAVTVDRPHGTAVGNTTLWLEVRTNGAQTQHLTVVSWDGERADLWEVESCRTSTITIRIVEAVDRLSVFPATLIFRPGQHTRRVKVFNGGSLARRLEFTATNGVVVTMPGNRDLQPNEETTLEVKIDAGVKDGSVKLSFRTLGHNGALNREVDLAIHAIPGGIAHVPDAFVGIDFGTANTTVSFRLFGAIVAQVLDLFGQGNRIPTEVFVPSSDKSTWVYGKQAFNEYTASLENGAFARNIKTALRQNPDSCIPGSDTVTYRHVATDFLRRILVEVVLPHVRSHCPDALEAKSLEFCFTTPVLDQGIELEEYQACLLDCARSAGYSQFGQVVFGLEPVAAASFVLREMQHGIQPGGKVVVFDSGGGTTDVCVGTLVVESSLVRLRDIETFDVPYDHARNFGGSTVTWALGKIWSSKYESAVRELVQHHDSNPPDKDPFFLEAAKPDQSLPLDEGELQFNPKWPWPDKYPYLWQETNRIKESAGQSAAFLYDRETLPGGATNPVKLTKRTLASLTGDFCQRFSTRLQAIAREMPTAKWFLIGGNMRLPGLAEHLSTVGAATAVPGDDLDLAVGKGASWLGEWVTGGLPYGLLIKVHEQEARLELGFRPSPGARHAVGGNLVVSTGQKLAVELRASISGADLQIGDWEIPCDFESDHGYVKFHYFVDFPFVTLQASETEGEILWRETYEL